MSMRRVLIPLFMVMALVWGLAPAAVAATFSVTGTVTESDGSAIEGAVVKLYSVKTTDEGSIERYDKIGEELTDESGRYAFDLAANGTYAIEAVAGGHGSRWLGGSREIHQPGTRFVTESDSGAALPSIELPETVAARGRVVTQSGALAGGVWVHPLIVNDAPGGAMTVLDYQEPVLSDEDGAFEVQIEVGSLFTLSTWTQGQWTYLGGTTDLWDEGTVILDSDALAGDPLPDLVVPDGTSASGRISGTIREPAGQSRRSHQVTLSRWYESEWGSSWSWIDSTWSDQANGRYSFDGVEDGVYTVSFGRFHLGGGESEPASPGPGNSVEIVDGAVKVVDFTMPVTRTVSGTVHGPLGVLGNASVQAYRWANSDWSLVDEAYTARDGRYEITSLTPGVYTLRTTRSRYDVGFLGGGTQFPTVPGASDSFTIADADVAGKDVTMTRRPSTLGKVAGQKLAYCEDEELYPNDDESSSEVRLPFRLRYFGNPYTSLFVNNNGNVTFDAPKSQYTPDVLNGATSSPIIAPFFADVDTRDTDESDVVTYGSSPDGTQFCVNWVDVEPFEGHRRSGEVNSYQLLLTKRQGTPGRTSGDFDITFNYDQIQWDTGKASGATSAVAGFASGTGAEGTFFQLPGSMEPRMLLDGGARALVAGRQNSSQDGRYVFEVRNEGRSSSLGNVTGRVVGPDGEPVAEAYVQVSNSARVFYTQTDALGRYTVSGLATGTYEVLAWPNDPGLGRAGASVVVGAGQSVAVPDLGLAAPRTMPPSVGLDSPSSEDAIPGTVPSVDYRDPLKLSYTGAPGGTARYSITNLAGEELRRGTLTETPAGVYTGTVPALTPAVGDAVVSITFTPAGGPAETTSFDIYIDPSGTVVDQWGTPVSGSTVTLLRSETVDGQYEPVPDGSTLMSPRNRANPDLTDADGSFGWDVKAAWYKVQVTARGYETFTTEPMQVPPERLDLVLALEGGKAPTATSSITGSPKVGAVLKAGGPTDLGSAVKVTGFQWMRNGRAITGATGSTHRVTSSDAGTAISVVATVQRDAVAADPLHPDNLISFTPFPAASASVKVPAAPRAAVPRRPGLTVKAKALGNGRAKVVVNLRWPGTARSATRAKVAVFDGRKRLRKPVVVRNGVGRVTLKGLRKGSHVIRVTVPARPGYSARTASVKVRIR